MPTIEKIANRHGGLPVACEEDRIASKATATPLTKEIFSLITAVQDKGKAARSESSLREDVGEKAIDWIAEARSLFNRYADRVSGVRSNEITFQAMLRIEIPGEAFTTLFDELPKKFAFDPWAGMGHGAILKIK